MKEGLPITSILIGICGVVSMGLLMYFSSPNDGGAKQVQVAAIGTKILGPWLRAGGIPVEESNPSLSPKASDLSLRILPLYDMDLASQADAPASRKDAFEASTLVELSDWVFDRKMQELTSLVILPKWRQGILTVEVAHHDSLIPLGEYQKLLQQIGLGAVKLVRGGNLMTVAETSLKGEVALFHAQVFDTAHLPQHCRSEVEMPLGSLVIFCRQDGEAIDEYAALSINGTYYLSDPDLMNNHGLRLGDNAQVTRNLVRQLVGGLKTPIYLDLSTELLLSDNEADQGRYYQRDLGDLGRLFAPPFTVLWAVLAIVMTVLFWRGSVTIIPRKALARMEVETEARDHPGLASAMAKARLLRLGGHDDQMVRAFVRSEIHRTYRQSLGRQPGGTIGDKPMLERMHVIWSRRDKARADQLVADALALMQEGAFLSPVERSRKLNSFRENLEILTHENPDISRISGSRRNAAP